MPKYKLIALDLDGTLLTSNKTVSESTYNALKKANDMGVVIVPCTGRFYSSMPEQVRNIPFIDYAITINGASIFNNKTKENIANKTFSADRAIKILEWMGKYDVACDAYIDNWGYMETKFIDNIEKYITNKFYIYIMKYERTRLDSLIGYIDEHKCQPQKVQLYSNDRDLIYKLLDEARPMFPDFEVSSSEENNIEFTDINASKGVSLIEFANSLGIKREEVIAFGDGGNDVSMLRAAGMGVAMGNAREFVKNNADFVTHDCDTDGIEYALNTLLF